MMEALPEDSRAPSPANLLSLDMTILSITKPLTVLSSRTHSSIWGH